jgi:hypothetical protein
VVNARGQGGSQFIEPNHIGSEADNQQHLLQATALFLGYADYEAHGSTKTRYQAGGFIMKAWLSSVCWNLAVALGFIEPPRLQPIPVRAQRGESAAKRR